MLVLTDHFPHRVQCRFRHPIEIQRFFEANPIPADGRVESESRKGGSGWRTNRSSSSLHASSIRWNTCWPQLPVAAGRICWMPDRQRLSGSSVFFDGNRHPADDGVIKFAQASCMPSTERSPARLSISGGSFPPPADAAHPRESDQIKVSWILQEREPILRRTSPERDGPIGS